MAQWTNKQYNDDIVKYNNEFMAQWTNKQYNDDIVKYNNEFMIISRVFPHLDLSGFE